jgi:hypothetical protein
MEGYELKESEVVDHIRRWLHESNKPILFDGTGGRYTGVDSIVEAGDPQNSQEPTEQIECKGEGSDIYKSIGQCLYYRFCRKIPTYLAIPQNLPYMKELIEIIDYFNLPIGLLLLGDGGTGSVKKTAR